MWNRDRQKGLKLYVQRVFIMDDAEQFMPTYLRFVKGLVDSNDLPLNVSREILQDSKVTQTLRKGCTSRVLKMLDRMGKKDKDNYQTVWDEFGSVLKEGPAEDQDNKDQILKLLRFSSSHEDSTVQNVSLEDYKSRMKEGQDKIYYIVTDSFEASKNSPHLEIFRKKGIEVLLMHDRMDEWMMGHVTQYEDFQFQSVTRGDLNLDEMDDEENLHINDDDEMMSCVEKRVRNTCLYLSSHLISSGLVTSHCSSSLELEDGTWISVWVPNHGASSTCCGALVVTQD